MQWNATENAGFTTGKPWLGINPNYTKINAESQKNDPHSIFSCYKALIALRKSSPALSRGDLEIPETGSDTLFALKRSYNGETLLSFHNFSAEPSENPRRARSAERRSAALLLRPRGRLHRPQSAPV